MCVALYIYETLTSETEVFLVQVQVIKCMKLEACWYKDDRLNLAEREKGAFHFFPLEMAFS